MNIEKRIREALLQCPALHWIDSIKRHVNAFINIITNMRGIIQAVNHYCYDIILNVCSTETQLNSMLTNIEETIVGRGGNVGDRGREEEREKTVPVQHIEQQQKIN